MLLLSFISCFDAFSMTKVTIYVIKICRQLDIELGFSLSAFLHARRLEAKQISARSSFYSTTINSSVKCAFVTGILSAVCDFIYECFCTVFDDELFCEGGFCDVYYFCGDFNITQWYQLLLEVGLQ